MWALKIWLLFKLLALTTFFSNMVQPQNFPDLLIIYLALQHCLQNPNSTFQYWDMCHQMTWYILAHMPYFRRPGHIFWFLWIDVSPNFMGLCWHSMQLSLLFWNIVGIWCLSCIAGFFYNFRIKPSLGYTRFNITPLVYA